MFENKVFRYFYESELKHPFKLQVRRIVALYFADKR
jgi:hypothetical protein